MFYILACIGVILALKLLADISYKRQNASFYQSHKLRDGFKVTKREFDEALQLLNRSFCSNEYCKRETVTLFIDVKRSLAKDKRIRDSFAFNEAILQYCKKATLDILNFQDTVQSAANEEVDADIIRLIEERAAVIVRPLGKESDRSFYNSGDAWKVRYSNLVNDFKIENVQQFYEDICQLGSMSDKRVTIQRDIYYKAHQFLVQKDKEYSLKLYLQYLHVKTLSQSFKHKKISKTSSQWLFRNIKEEQQFGQIGTKLVKSNNINAALKQVDSLGIGQRKKINLDVTAIREAAGKQAKVAGILSDLLADEAVIQPEQTAKETAVLQNDSPVIDNKEHLLRLFIDNSYKLDKEEVDIFARSKGIFMNQLIQRINEEYFDELDDVLIEEENEHYLLNKTYLQQVRG